MRILHVPFCFYPDPVGGTEVYVAQLAQAQRRQGCEAAVAAPGSVPAAYEHAGIPIWRFPVSPSGDLREIYGEGNRKAAEAFGQILDEYRPDIVHVHALTPAVSVQLIKQAKRRGLPVVFNYHTPTVGCMNGSLLRWGSTICDGVVDHRICTSCALHGHGLPRPVSRLVAAIPPSIGRRLGDAGLSGRMWTALRASELAEIRMLAFREFMDAVDHVIALCNWTRELLIRNGVRPEKITLCRHGIGDYSTEDSRPSQPPEAPIRAAFLGRFDPTKGAHTVVQALRDEPGLPILLDLYGVRQGEGGDLYAKQLDALIARDSRIRILAPLRSSEVIPRLCSYDVLVVPSQWLETGPLVVLEAFAAGTPVLGSNLGGIAELVTHGIDGLLVEPADSPKAWGEALATFCAKPWLRDSLRHGIRRPRHMHEVAHEIIHLYQSLGCKPAMA